MAYRPIIQFGIVALVCLSGAIATFGFAQAAFGWHLVWSDFTVFWTAARLGDPYNAKALTEAQQWILPSGSGPRPFPYPPTALLFLRPLAWSGYYPAAFMWVALGLAAFVSASLLYGRRAMIVLFSPMVGLTLAVGQMALFVGGAMAAAVALLGRREILAGLLFGIVGAVKPQTAILVPIALTAGRHWRALGASILAGALTIAASLVLGPQLWVEWFATLGAFSNQVLTAENVGNMSPGLQYAPLGAGCVVATFYLSERAELRLVALVSGTCLCLPYAMNYDLVAMAPAAAILMFRRDPMGWVVGFFAFSVFWISPIMAAIGAALMAYHKLSPALVPSHGSRLSSSVELNTASRTRRP